MTADEFDALVFIKGSDPNYRATKAARLILIENNTMDVALFSVSIPTNDSMWRDRVRTEVARFEAADRCIREAYGLDSLKAALKKSEEEKVEKVTPVEEVIPVEVSRPSLLKPQLKEPNKMTGEERAQARIALRNAEAEQKRLKRETDLKKSRYAKY
jgi:hypothetical protein